MLLFQLYAKFINIEQVVRFSPKEDLAYLVVQYPDSAPAIYTALDSVAHKKGFSSIDIQRLVDATQRPPAVLSYVSKYTYNLTQQEARLLLYHQSS